MSSAEYDRLVKAVFGTEERLAALETAGVIPLEGRMDKHEQDQAAHGTSGGLENSEFLTRLAEAGEALRKAAGL